MIYYYYHYWLNSCQITVVIFSSQSSNLLTLLSCVPAVFLSFISILESWLIELSPPGDVIALRFLLFLSHTYGAVLLLTTFLIAAETLIRLLWPHAGADHRTAGQTAGSDGQRCHVGDITVQEEGESRKTEKDRGSAHVVGFLCCLSVWVIVAVNVSRQYKLEEVWTAACLHTTDSLVRCLPSLLSPVPGAVNPCWSMAFLFFLLLLLTISTSLRRRHHPPAWTEMTQEDRCCWKDLVPAFPAPYKPVYPGMEVSEPAQRADPQRDTKNGLADKTAFSWTGVQMLACHHGDFVVMSTECFPGKKGGKGHEGTKRRILLTFITEEHVDSQQHSSQCGWQQWGFPSLQVNVMIVGVLSVFVLPFNLSVNILLIRTIDALLEWCIKSVLSSAASSRDTLASLSVSQV